MLAAPASHFSKAMKTFLRTGARVLRKTTSGLYKQVETLRTLQLLFDECNIGVVGFGGRILIYRNKDCKIPVPPEPELPDNYNYPVDIPSSNSGLYIIFINKNYYYEQGKARGTPPQAWAEEYSTRKVIKIEYPYTGSVRILDQYYPYQPLVPEFYIKYEVRTFFKFNGIYFAAFRAGTNPYRDIEIMEQNGYEINIVEHIFYPYSTYTKQTVTTKEFYGQIFNNTVEPNMLIRRSREDMVSLINNNSNTYRNRRTTTKGAVSYGTYNGGFFPFPVPGKYAGFVPLIQTIDDFYGTYYYGYADNLRIEQTEINYTVVDGNYLPPVTQQPPPPKDHTKPMDCCARLEQLLQLTLKRIGSDNLPASVPNSLVRKNSGTKQINSLAEYISYSVKQMDALMGKFPLEITIDDADLTEEGDQSKTLTMPNLAESLSEIIGILLILQSESNANLAATISTLVEAGSGKQAAIIGADYAKANSEYLGYKGKLVEREIPFAFKPGEPRLDKMLVAGNYKVRTFENDDKDDLNDALAPVLELAAMWKAQNFRNLGTTGTLEKLKQVLTSAVGLSDSIDELVNRPPPEDPNNPPSEPMQPKKSDFDNFLEEAEQGFIGQAGITDNTKPYGRPFAQRPRIRELGKTSDEEV